MGCVLQPLRVFDIAYISVNTFCFLPPQNVITGVPETLITLHRLKPHPSMHAQPDPSAPRCYFAISRAYFHPSALGLGSGFRQRWGAKKAVWSGDVVSRLIGLSVYHISTLIEYNGNFVSCRPIHQIIAIITTSAPCNPHDTSEYKSAIMGVENKKTRTKTRRHTRYDLSLSIAGTVYLCTVVYYWSTVEYLYFKYANHHVLIGILTKSSPTCCHLSISHNIKQQKRPRICQAWGSSTASSARNGLRGRTAKGRT